MKYKTKEIQRLVRRNSMRNFFTGSPIRSLLMLLCLVIAGICLMICIWNIASKKSRTASSVPKASTMEQSTNTNTIKKQTVSTEALRWYDYRAVAHALGGIGGKAYTNTCQGFEESYKKGYKVFEMDLLLTSDQVLVGRHRWADNLSDPEAKGGQPPSYAEFKKTKLYGTYTPSSLEEVLALLKKYPDTYLMTDTKYSTDENVRMFFEQLVKTVKKSGGEKLLDRIVVQVYNDRMYQIMKTIYPFKNVNYSTYKLSDARLSKIINFCKANNIKAITIKSKLINDYRTKEIRDAELHCYTHAINTAYDVGQFMDLGVYGIYSDFVSAYDIENIGYEKAFPDYASRLVNALKEATTNDTQK